MRISYNRKVEENKLKHEAFAFATALLRQAEDFQSKLSVIYHVCNSAARDGSYEYGVTRFCEDMNEITVPELFEAPWRDIGLLNPDVTLLIHSITRSLQLAKSMVSSNRLVERQPTIPGLLNRSSIMNEPEKEKTQSEMEHFLRQQIGYYDDMIKQELQALIICLEAEAEEYAMQLGLDEKKVAPSAGKGTPGCSQAKRRRLGCTPGFQRLCGFEGRQRSGPGPQPLARP